MIENHGYTCEIHNIQTEDGYIITYHRIPSKIDEPSDGKITTFVLAHGQLSSSADYVNMGNRSLAFYLSDAGYDVWLSNARGNAFSRNHTSLDPTTDKKKFFNFSWHEIGYYDLPASIDYILDIKQEESLYYVGHSQGTTAFLVMASTRPEYNRKVKLAHLMAPAAFMSHCPAKLARGLSSRVEEFTRLLDNMNIYEIPMLQFVREMGMEYCKTGGFDLICRFLMAFLQIQIDEDLLPVVMTNAPSNAAIKQVLHYGQAIKRGRFAQFDYGSEKNLKVYGSEMPPDYDLSKITIPIVIYYGLGDTLVAPEDVQILISLIPNLVEAYLVPNNSFNHYDFVYHKNVINLLYKEILRITKLH